MSWLRKLFITRVIKGVLDKLPFNNKKTLLGIVVFIGSLIVQLWPTNPIIPIIKEILKVAVETGATDYMQVSIYTILLGLGHKWLKK